MMERVKIIGYFNENLKFYIKNNFYDQMLLFCGQVLFYICYCNYQGLYILKYSLINNDRLKMIRNLFLGRYVFQYMQFKDGNDVFSIIIMYLLFNDNVYFLINFFVLFQRVFLILLKLIRRDVFNGS